MVALMAACAAPGAPAATPIPASVAQPPQSTPEFRVGAERFSLNSVTPTVIFITPTVAASNEELAVVPEGDSNRGALLRALLMNQPPSAMGIATGGATLLDRPGGSVVTSVAGGATVTATGRSADGNWLAVYTAEALSGWIPVGSVVLFGADDLLVVDEAFSPAPVATMLAEALAPEFTPMATYFAQLTATPQPPVQPAATPVPQAADGGSADAALSGALLLGQVIATGNVNLRSAPELGGSVLASLAPQVELIVTGRSEAGDWLRVRTPSGDGWVSANFVEVTGDMASLAVVQ
jgi:hypothetical protein